MFIDRNTTREKSSFQWQAGHLIWELHFPIIDTISLDQILRAPIDNACGFGLYEW